MANSTEHTWRKHVYVLIMSTDVQWAQIVLSLLFVLVVIPVLHAHLGVTIPPALGMSVLVVFFSIWTVIHLNRGLRTPPVKNGDSSALARRQALLTRLSTPIRRVVGIVSILSTVFVVLGIIVLLFAAAKWVWAPIALYYLFLAAWLGIEIADWNNDQYILTEDRIIDIMRLPVIYEQRTEAPLAMVQNATAYQNGFIAKVLNLGNVQVETAGYARAILFESVWRPRQIQEEIFEHIDALNQATRQRERAAQTAQTMRWFEAYHTLAGGILHIRYDENASTDQTIHIQWRIQGPPNRQYRTWMEWDTTSRASGEVYAQRLRPEGKPWYADGKEIDGVGAGLHHIRGFSAPPGQPTIYFRIIAWFEGEQPRQSSPEMTIVIREPSRV